jgi:hypothetical protein
MTTTDGHLLEDANSVAESGTTKLGVLIARKSLLMTEAPLTCARSVATDPEC